MRKMVAAVLAFGLAAWGVNAFADETVLCPSGTELRLIGSIKTGADSFGAASPTPAGTTVSTAGNLVRRIVGRCGGTACVVGVADSDTIGAAAAADYEIEPGAPANTVFDLSFGTGLRFDNGISVGDTTGNTQSISFYECR